MNSLAYYSDKRTDIWYLKVEQHRLLSFSRDLKNADIFAAF